MKVIIKTDMSYLNFLQMIQEVSTNSHTIQNNAIKKVLANHDICRLKSKLDRQIEYFNGLLSDKK